MNNYYTFLYDVLDHANKFGWEDFPLQKPITITRLDHYLKKLIHIDLYYEDDILFDWGTANRNQIKSLMLWDVGVRDTLYIFSFMKDHAYYEDVGDEYPYNIDYIK